MVQHRDVTSERLQKGAQERSADLTAWRSSVSSQYSFAGRVLTIVAWQLNEQWSKDFAERTTYREKLLDQEAASAELRAALDSSLYSAPVSTALLVEDKKGKRVAAHAAHGESKKKKDKDAANFIDSCVPLLSPSFTAIDCTCS
mgnify:CR=1 FL=1